jgi:hypothetical protein
MPEPRGMLTTRSSANGPGASKRCLPNARTPAATNAAKTNRVMIALPMTTNGCRAFFERFGGRSTVSGSSAVRGLRGAKCLLALAAAALPTNPSADGGLRSPATDAGFPAAGLVTAGRAVNDAAAGRVVAADGGVPLELAGRSATVRVVAAGALADRGADDVVMGRVVGAAGAAPLPLPGRSGGGLTVLSPPLTAAVRGTCAAGG